MAEQEKLRSEIAAGHEVPIKDALLFKMPSSQTLAKLSPKVLKEFARQQSAELLFPQISNFSDEQHDEILAALRTEQALAATGFWDHVSQFAALLESNVVDFLKRRGIQFRESEGESEYLLRALSENPMLCADALSKLREAQGPSFDGKSSAVFASNMQGNLVYTALKSLDPNFLEAKLQEKFESNGYGSVCDVERLVKEDRISFRFHRCGRQKDEVKVDTQNKRRFRKDRSIKSDVISYFRETNTLWVYVHGRGAEDVEMYVDCFGEMLGNAENFRRRHSFKLDVFKDPKLGELLRLISSDLELARIDLKKIEIRTGKNGRYSDSTVFGERCLTDRLSEMPLSNPAGVVKYVRLRLHHNLQDKKYVDLDLQPENVSLGAGLEEEVLSALLAKLGIWVADSNA